MKLAAFNGSQLRARLMHLGLGVKKWAWPESGCWMAWAGGGGSHQPGTARP